jgi:hypothetical protein
MMRTWLVVCVVVLGGCDLYFGGGDDAPCYGEGEVDGYYEYRDPATNTCSGYGGPYCDGSCGPCPQAVPPLPDLALCTSQCTGLAEATCRDTSGCYAYYYDDPAADGKRVFEGCAATAPSGPVQGMCEGLDAHECSRHDDCSIVYATFGANTYGSKFLACVTETQAYCLSDTDCGEGARCDTTSCHYMPCPDCGPNCGICYEGTLCYGVCVSDNPSCAAVDCGPGYHCEEQCYPTDGESGPVMSWCTTACVPDDSSCSLIDCGPGYECVESCELAGNGTFWCDATCVPTNNDPGSCYGDVLCDSLPPACPSGTTAGRSNGCWTGYCIPNADCGPNDPGSCYGEVACDALPPACPSGTTPGRSDTCWTGYCIPNGQCEAAACETLSTETACSARADCTAVYTGTNCTCTLNGCTCETLSYARCESQWLAP